MSERLKYGLIAILALLLFLPNTGLMPLYDWVETGFAEAAKDMAISNDFFTIHVGDKPFVGFQPLFIWMQAISMKIFGINEFAARFPNAICGVFTLLVLFYIGKRLANETFGWLWVLLYTASLIPFYFFRTGLPEPWHNLFVLIGMTCMYEFLLTSNHKRKSIFVSLAAISFGLAFLTNGFWSWIILGLSMLVLSIVKMLKIKVRIKYMLIFLGILLVISSIWLVIAAFQGKTGYVLSCYKFQFHRVFAMNTGREGFFPMYVLLVIMGMFPASILAFNIIRRQRKDDREPLHEFRNLMMILFLVAVGFQVLMRPRISNYSTFAFIPITFFASYVVSKLHELNQDLPKWTSRIILLGAIIWGVFVMGLELMHRYKDYILSSTFLDRTMFKEVFEANVVVPRAMLIVGLAYIFGIMTFFMLGRFKFFTKLAGILALTILFNYATFLFILPHVEAYKQGSLIAFYKEKRTEDCYIVPIGFMSYGQFFYGNKQRIPYNKALLNSRSAEKSAKTVYFVFKVNIDPELLKKLGEINRIKQEGGYIFAKKVNQQ